MKIGLSFNGLCVILFLIFMVLKLCRVVAWAWAIVCIPLYCMACWMVVLILFWVIYVVITTKNSL